MSAPRWSACVAKLWRKVWLLTRLAMPTLEAADLSFIDRCFVQVMPANHPGLPEPHARDRGD